MNSSNIIDITEYLSRRRALRALNDSTGLQFSEYPESLVGDPDRFMNDGSDEGLSDCIEGQPVWPAG